MASTVSCKRFQRRRNLVPITSVSSFTQPPPTPRINPTTRVHIKGGNHLRRHQRVTFREQANTSRQFEALGRGGCDRERNKGISPAVIMFREYVTSWELPVETDWE